MHNTFTPGRRGRLAARRLAPFAAAGLAAAALAAPAGAQAPASPIAVDAAKDSVVVSGLGYGQATLQVTRPDVDTGKPVVIGLYSGVALPGQAFSVNTAAPSLFKPNGDCWQAGKLALPSKGGLVPDLLPGDTVTIAGKSVTVPSEGFDYQSKAGGPIAGCDKLSSWGRNMVGSASFAGPGADLSVSGNSQPLTAGVGVTATDGKHTTAAATATLAADGSWNATIPATELANLDNGKITVHGIYAVPDVATGTAAHIHGRALSVDLQMPAAAVAPEAPVAPAAPAAPVAMPKIKLGGLQVPSKISLSAARAGKMNVSFIVPTGARYARVRLARPGHTALMLIVPAATSGSRQTVRLSGAKLKQLVRGRYAVTVGAGATKTQLGSPVLRGSVLVR